MCIRDSPPLSASHSSTHAHAQRRAEESLTHTHRGEERRGEGDRQTERGEERRGEERRGEERRG
eukprot:2506138-Rhodomonas_salina.1